MVIKGRTGAYIWAALFLLLFLRGVQARTVRVVAAPYTPFVFQQDGKLTGFDIDLLNTICSINRLDCKVKLVTFEQMMNMLVKGEADVGIGAIYVTEERKKAVNFTRPYLNTGLVMVSLATRPVQPNELENKRVGVKKGATGEQVARRLARKFRGLQIVSFISTEESFDALAKGQVDVVFNDYINTVALAFRRYPGLFVINRGLLGPYFLTRDKIAIPVNKRDRKLLEIFDRTLARLEKAGYIKLLSEKWLHIQMPPDYGRYFIYASISFVVLTIIILLLFHYSKALQQTRTLANYMKMVEVSPEAVLIVRKGRIIYANEASKRLFGVRANFSIMDRSIQDYLSANLLEEIEKLERAGKENLVVEMEGRLKAEDGEVKDVEVSMVTLRLGKELAVKIILRDITERKRARKELEESENRFRAAVENAPSPVVIFNEKGEILIVNRSFERLTGHTKEDFGTIWEWVKASVVDDEIREHIKEGIKDLFRERRTSLYIPEVEVLCRKGRVKRLWTLTVSLISSKKDNRLAMLIGRDITDFKILERNLIHTQKMEAIGRLAGGIAHDFNNLLNAILGFCELAIMELPEDSPVMEYLQQIKEAGNRAAELARGLLAFSKRSALKTGPLNLNETIRRMEKILRRIIGEDIEFELKLEEPLDTIKADPVQMESAIVNLVVNAKDAMPHGGKLIISTRKVHLDRPKPTLYGEIPPGDYILLSVSDTGIGMDEYVKRRIFEPYFTTKEDKSESAGLGLAAVYATIVQCGGFVDVESKKGEGTTFYIYLPVSRGEGEREKKARRAAAFRKGRGEKIMVVEDEELVRELLVQVLSKSGYEVFSASTPEEAERMVSKENCRIDLLISDVILPGCSGIALAERLRKICPGLKVLFISGYTGEYISKKESLKGDIQILHKPITASQLLEKISELLQQKESSSLH